MNAKQRRKRDRRVNHATRVRWGLGGASGSPGASWARRWGAEEFWDVVYCAWFMEVLHKRIEAELLKVFASQPKIPYTGTGLALVEAAVKAGLNKSVEYVPGEVRIQAATLPDGNRCEVRIVSLPGHIQPIEIKDTFEI